MRLVTFWLSCLTLIALLPCSFISYAAAGGMSSHDMLLENEWQWEKTRYNNDTETVPENSERYFLTFGKAGTFWGLADCNRIRGNFTLSGSQIVLGPIMSTRAMCPPDSLDSIFLKDLERVAILFFKEDRLYIDLKYHSGTMAFLPKQGVDVETQEAEKVQVVACKDPRPEVCTMEYDPVCGERKDNLMKTYSNGCNACSDPGVIRYRYGECP